MKIKVLFIAVVMAVMAAQVSDCYAKTNKKTEITGQSMPVSDSDKIRIMAIVRTYLEERLKSPSTANYSGYGETSVRSVGDKYGVAGWVDSQNSFGAMLRMKYVIVLKKVGDRDFRIIEFAKAN